MCYCDPIAFIETPKEGGEVAQLACPLSLKMIKQSRIIQPKKLGVKWFVSSQENVFLKNLLKWNLVGNHFLEYSRIYWGLNLLLLLLSL